MPVTVRKRRKKHVYDADIPCKGEWKLDALAAWDSALEHLKQECRSKTKTIHFELRNNSNDNNNNNGLPTASDRMIKLTEQNKL